MRQSVKVHKGSITKLKNGKEVQYLSKRYNINGKRKTSSFNKKYLYVNPNSAIEKKHNKDVLNFVEEVVAEEQRKLDRSSNGLEDLTKLDRPFMEMYQEYRELNGANWKSAEVNKWDICKKHLEEFHPNVTVRGINHKFSQKFYNFLASKRKKNGELLHKNSVEAYFKPFVQVSKDLWQEGLLQKNPTNRVKKRTQETSQAPSLTEEELKIAFNTPAPRGWQQVINAFLFSCLTGLRVSDIMELRWRDIITDSNNNSYLLIEMQKTETPIKVWLNEQAIELMGEIQNEKQKIFPQVSKHAYQYLKLKEWIKFKCKIDKDITWHSARHTFAYRYLRHHNNAVHLMNLLGHKNISTTMTYFNYKFEDTKEELLNMPKL